MREDQVPQVQSLVQWVDEKSAAIRACAERGMSVPEITAKLLVGAGEEVTCFGQETIQGYVATHIRDS